MNTLDHTMALFRCWEHEDCVEHPELGLACADGRVTRLGGELDEDGGCRFTPAREQDASCQRFSMPGDGRGVPRMSASPLWGDGCEPFGYGLGVGDGHGNPIDPTGGGGSGDPSWYDYDLCEEDVE